MEISQSISSSPPPNLPCEDLLAEGRREDYFNIGVTLYEASINGNWAAAQQILQIHPEMVRFAITEGYDTTLHVAASVEETMLTRRFVKNLVARMDTRCLEFQNLNSNTAFCLAAAIGNTQIARIMLEKNPNLVNIPGADGMMPLYMSVLHGKYETMQYLFHASVQMRGDIWTDVNRGWVLQRCVESDLFDVAMEIVADRPDLAVNGSVLGALARKPHVFDELEQNYNLMERFINTIGRITHMKMEPPKKHGDALKLLRIIWRHTIKTMPKNALDGMLKGSPDPISQINGTFGEQKYSSRILFIAAERGNTIFIKELLRTYPDLAWKTDDDNRTIFHIAVMHRHPDIYKLMYKMGSRKDKITLLKDKDGNNMLHLVGKTIGKTMCRTSGSVTLQLKGDLEWFKEVEDVIPAAYRETKNNVGEQPYDIFSTNNHNLVVECLKWVKYCMVIATLFISMTFTVAYSGPGGYNQTTGFPIFNHKPTFLVYVMAEAISFLSSITSLIVHISILASRHEKYDSLILLTKKLMICLITLFISMSSLVVAFCTSFFILYQNELIWIPILITVFAITPFIAMMTLKFRLLIDMCFSIYYSRI